MKAERQDKILELINAKKIGTQEELADALQEAGFYVTQATVSRDIRQLNLTKSTDEQGNQRYITFNPSGYALNEKYAKVLKEGFISMSVACNILVIKTVPGMAMAVCAAVDALGFEEEVGSIAGDDTIMIATVSTVSAKRLGEKIGNFC